MFHRLWILLQHVGIQFYRLVHLFHSTRTMMNMSYDSKYSTYMTLKESS